MAHANLAVARKDVTVAKEDFSATATDHLVSTADGDVTEGLQEFSLNHRKKLGFLDLSAGQSSERPCPHVSSAKSCCFPELRLKLIG